MAEAWGNILDPPGFKVVAEVKPGDILYALGHGIIKKGVTLLSGQGVIAAGTVIARQTASKKYVVYNNAGSGGAEVADGILAEAVDTASGDKLGNVYFGGAFKLDKLTGLDSNAIADLNGYSDADRNFFSF